MVTVPPAAAIAQIARPRACWLQLIPIPGLEGVHFGKESYILLLVWIVIGIVFAGICKMKKV